MRYDRNIQVIDNLKSFVDIYNEDTHSLVDALNCEHGQMIDYINEHGHLIKNFQRENRLMKFAGFMGFVTFGLFAFGTLKKFDSLEKKINKIEFEKDLDSDEFDDLDID